MPADKHQALNVIVTGVSRGLGRALVDEFARLGHTVLGCARTVGQINELSQLYPAHDFQPVDVASDSEVNGWAERVLDKYGPPDLLLNNAAVVNLKAALWEVNAEELSNEIDINVKGVVNVIRHFVPPMIRRRQGVIVNFSSRWGTNFEKNMGPYCATKWAVVALTRTLAEELRPVGVAAVAFNPGIVRTGMLERYLGDSAKSLACSYPSATAWASIAVPFILRLGMKDTGKSRNVLNSPFRPITPCDPVGTGR